MGSIFNIQRFCIHDGTGIRTTVFFKGCPLKCIWCHNPESLDRVPILLFDDAKCTACGQCLSVCKNRTIQNARLIFDRKKCTVCGQCVHICPNHACEIMGYEISAEEVMNEVMKDQMFYASSGGGITLSGGEPSYQPEFALQILSIAKEAGISMAMETCGIGDSVFYREAANLGCEFLFDLKAIDPFKHKALTASDNAHILRNLDMLFDLNASVYLRMPLVPGVNDSDEDIALLAKVCNAYRGQYKSAEIMPYHTLGLEKARKMQLDAKTSKEGASKKDIARWIEIFKQHGIAIDVSQ